jgi:iron complex outermembrane receptor protein
MNLDLKRSVLLGFIMTAAGASVVGTTALAEGDAKEGATDDLTEIVVTARRVEERLIDVPISISVFNQKQLDNFNMTSTADLTKYVPSLSLDERFGPDSASFSLRGFFEELGSTPTVGVYFAEAVSPRGSLGQTTGGDGVGPGALFDLANVQVLKGPQGTLFGRNTTGGAVLLVPVKPTSEVGGYAESEVGNHGEFRQQGVINLPFSDSVRVRLGVDHMKRSGWQDNVSGIGPSAFGNVDYTAARASVVVDITPNLENYLIGTYSNSNTYGVQNKVLGCNPTAGYGPLLALLNVCNVDLARMGNNFWAVDNGYANRQPESYLRQSQAINTTTWSVTDDLRIKNILTYGRFASLYVAQPFGDNFIWNSSAPALQLPALAGLQGLVSLVNGQHLYLEESYPTPGYYTNSQDTMSEEIQVQGYALDRRLTYQSGLYLERSNPRGPSAGLPDSFAVCYNQVGLDCFDIANLLTGGLLRGGVTSTYSSIQFRDYGIYTQGGYAITSQLKLNVGVRYTWDQMYGQGSNTLIGFNPTAQNPAAPGANAPVYSCFFANATAVNQADLAHSCQTYPESNSRAPTWVIDLDYKPIEDLMMYAKYSRGYREGGVNPRTVITTYGPEKVDAYEVGSKYAFSGNVAGNINAAAFYNNFKNQQVLTSLVVNLPGAAEQQALVNLGSSRSYGFEMDGSLEFFRRFRLDLSGSYLDSRVTNVGAAANVIGLLPSNLQVPGVVTVTTDATTGQPLPIAPKWRGSATGTYVLPVPAKLGNLSIGLNYTYTSKEYATSPSFFTSSYVPDAGYFPAVALWNLNASWNNVIGTPIDLGLFVTNLFDHKYIAALLGGFNSLGYEAGNQGQPTMYGVSIKYRFGH